MGAAFNEINHVDEYRARYGREWLRGDDEWGAIVAGNFTITKLTMTYDSFRHWLSEQLATVCAYDWQP